MKILELISETWFLFPFVPDVLILSTFGEKKKLKLPKYGHELSNRPGSDSQPYNEVANFFLFLSIKKFF